MQDGFCFAVLKVRVLYHFKRQVQSYLAYSEYSFVQVFLNWIWFICRLFCSPKCSFNFNLTWSSVFGIVFHLIHVFSHSFTKLAINGLLDKKRFCRRCKQSTILSVACARCQDLNSVSSFFQAGKRAAK